METQAPATTATETQTKEPSALEKILAYQKKPAYKPAPHGTFGLTKSVLGEPLPATVEAAKKLGLIKTQKPPRRTWRQFMIRKTDSVATIRKKWLAAMRSGLFNQVQSCFVTKDTGDALEENHIVLQQASGPKAACHNGGVCAMGVLKVISPWRSVMTMGETEVGEMAGLREDEVSHIIDMNDDNEDTLNVIADEIETTIFKESQ